MYVSLPLGLHIPLNPTLLGLKWRKIKFPDFYQFSSFCSFFFSTRSIVSCSIMKGQHSLNNFASKELLWFDYCIDINLLCSLCVLVHQVLTVQSLQNLVCRWVKLHYIKHNFKRKPALPLLWNILPLWALLFLLNFKIFGTVFSNTLCKTYCMKKKITEKYHFSLHLSLYHSITSITPVHIAHIYSLQPVSALLFETHSKFKWVCCVISGFQR